jgi:hypothetical protein
MKSVSQMEVTRADRGSSCFSDFHGERGTFPCRNVAHPLGSAATMLSSWSEAKSFERTVFT